MDIIDRNLRYPLTVVAFAGRMTLAAWAPGFVVVWHDPGVVTVVSGTGSLASGMDVGAKREH